MTAPSEFSAKSRSRERIGKRFRQFDRQTWLLSLFGKEQGLQTRVIDAILCRKNSGVYSTKVTSHLQAEEETVLWASGQSMSVIGMLRQRETDYHVAMKTAFIVMCVIVICTPTVVAQSWRLDRARLCFAREEDNGAMNTLQSWIRVSDYDVPITGGQAVCLYVLVGSTDLVITSTIPYDPHSRNAEACKSKVLKLELKENENRTFSIYPATNHNGYRCGWQIKETTNPAKATR